MTSPRTVTTPPDTWGVWDSVKLTMLEVLAPNSDRAATLRWRRINASQPAECRCGKPGTVRISDGHGFTGSTAPYSWRCADHATVPPTTPWRNGCPLVGFTREECEREGWITSSIATGIITGCACGTHVGEPR